MRLIFLGPPGAGKGTQAQRLAAFLKVPRLTTGDLLREAMRKGSALGIKVKQFVEGGQLVPDNVILEVMGERMQAADCKKGWLLDGFPRTLKQAQGLDAWLEQKGQKLNRVLQLDVPLVVAKERLTGRRQCETCGLAFHIRFQPPKYSGTCDTCGGKLVQRKDDAPEAVETRLKVYEQQTKPLSEYYGDRKLLKTVDGTTNPEMVFGTIRSLIG